MDTSRYLDLFLGESRDHLGSAHELLAQLEEDVGDPTLWRELMRHAHSLKGMAASMRLAPIADLTHAAESLALRLDGAPPPEARAYLPLLAETLVCLGRMLDDAERREPPDRRHADTLTLALQAEPAAPPSEDPGHAADPLPCSGEPADAQAALWRVAVQLTADPGGRSGRIVRGLLGLSTVGRIVRSAPPVLPVVAEAGSGRLEFVLSSRWGRARLLAELQRLLGPARVTLSPESSAGPDVTPEPPTIRWTRVRAERLDALVEGLLELREIQADAEDAADDEARGILQHHLQRGRSKFKELYGIATELRMIAFDSVAHRLRQGVDELAREQDKRVRFRIDGGDVRFDRVLLEALVDPLLHAVRNAVSHGVEPPDERRAAGKHEAGRVEVAVERAGERLAIAVRDDGRGIRPDGLRRAAVDLGELTPEEASELTDEEALLLATIPRLSTLPHPDLHAGRGVGLDVVRHAVEALGGFLEILSEPTRGCELRLCVPLRRAWIRALVVRSCGHLFALPMDRVLRSIDIDRDPPVPPDTSRPALPLISLARSLGLGEPTALPGVPRQAVVVATEERPLGLVLDELLGVQDLVVQPLSAPLSRVEAYSGAALLKDGSIVLVLDPAGIRTQSDLTPGASPASGGSAPWARRRSSGPRPSRS